ncbi:FAD/NAD(P)-binding domain-containing protein [Aspergillus heteromorphus CBS 117.55]|uniref:FAD/NAD(P)-binding domain-containing protein n=1 Tax=Aspergillus heteromorphus CBS 117.55 TaxID=1448321 RepID=A0A317W312_9EURO|nr:FAD/NAD(P)-binding domain-containing protein [Aspergillus heteromorphus CBS 117.55]PWY79637.1 FAD/NAD(P)-binding domain-containing protein [Aspergillus heteromorphus CBS 117.55]
MVLSKQIRRVAVIGAGPSGLAAVKYLLAEKHFERVDVFEKRSSAGGVWNYCPGTLKENLITAVPQLDPNRPLEEPLWYPTAGQEKPLEPVFVSPLYKHLDTNIPKELMGYGDQSFEPDSQVFPKHFTVKKYLDEYAEEIRDIIRFETQVVDLRKAGGVADPWSLTTKSLREGTEKTHSYDAVVVASGHYDVPYTPDILGISDWNTRYPGIISHSRLFDSAEFFRQKKVIVVGTSASGLDIGNQISEVCKGALLISQRSESPLAPTVPSPNKIYRPEIVEFLPPGSHERAVRFADGHIEQDIDAIVFCTGYLYSFPFLPSLERPVISNGRRAQNTYQHLFYIYDPTLVFPALPQRIIPLPLSENQAAVFARVWSGRLSLPAQDEMRAWEDSTIAEKGNETPFHFLSFPLDADYLNFFHDWAARAEPRQGLANDGNGKQCNYWGEKQKWIRRMLPEIKRTFLEKAQERDSIKTLEQLGYDFEKWKREQDDGVSAPKL